MVQISTLKSNLEKFRKNSDFTLLKSHSNPTRYLKVACRVRVAYLKE